MTPLDAILDIQREYLRLLESHFKNEREELDKYARHDEFFLYVEAFIREHFARKQSSVIVPYRGRDLTTLEYKLFLLIDEIESFWDSNGAKLAKHLEDSNLLFLYVACEPKDVPHYVSQYAIYFDTLCVPCPLYGYQEVLEERLKSDKRVESVGALFARYVALHHTMKNLLSKTYPPMFLIVPSQYLLSGEEIESIYRSRDQHAHPKLQLVADRYYFHCRKLFEEVFERDFDFDNTLEAGRFIASLDPKQVHTEKLAVLARLVDVNFLYLQFEHETFYHHELDEHILYGLKALAKGQPSYVSSETLIYLWGHFVQHLLMTGNICLDSYSLGIDTHFFPYFWELYRWQSSNESTEIRRVFNLSESEVAAYTISTKLQWLAQLPLDAVMSIRSDESLAGMRKLFRENRNKLGNVTVRELDSVSQQIAAETEKQISSFHSLCADRKKRLWKSLRASGASFFSTCALSIASMVTPVALPLAIVSAIYSLVLGGKSIRGLYHEYCQGTSNLKKLKQTPVGILAGFYQQQAKGDKQ